MLNRCVNCGGLLNYDIESANLKCESCDSYFDPEDFKEKTEAEEYRQDEKVTVFTCPTCGGEVTSTEADAVEYCLYCGSFVTLDSQIKKIRRPDYIMPFSKTKEECKLSYKNMVKKKLYAPSEFKDDKFLEGFKGIYIPYWTYDYEYGPDVKITACEESRHGDYIHKQYYNITADASGYVNGVDFDASSNFDDDISERIVPFDHEKLTEYNSAYMFGFFGDTADVTEDVFYDDSAEIARDEIWYEVATKKEIAEKHPTRKDGAKFDNDFQVERMTSLSMLPVWFLTWRKNDRVAYSIVNGSNGDIYCELPVDTKKYLMISLLTAVPIFLILEMFFTFSASKMLTITMLMSLFTVILYNVQLEKIVRRLKHVDDKGYISRHEDAKEEAEKVTTNIFSGLGSGLVDMVGSLGVIGCVVFIVICVALAEYLFFALIIIAIIIPIYTVYRIGKNSKLLNDKKVWFDVFGSFAALIISMLMKIIDPAGDIFYYVTAIVCICLVALTQILIMRRYNDLVTRPLPHFFDRKAGGVN